MRDREDCEENDTVELGGDRGGRGTRVGSIRGIADVKGCCGLCEDEAVRTVA